MEVGIIFLAGARRACRREQAPKKSIRRTVYIGIPAANSMYSDIRARLRAAGSHDGNRVHGTGRDTDTSNLPEAAAHAGLPLERVQCAVEVVDQVGRVFLAAGETDEAGLQTGRDQLVVGEHGAPHRRWMHGEALD